MRTQRPVRTQWLLSVGALVATAALTASCARQWPAEPPDVYEWQLTTAPLNLLPAVAAGRTTTAFAYARERPEPPACDGVGLDDCDEYVGKYGRQLPARLSITCWDDNADGEGPIDITFAPSRPVLDYPSWHPRSWSGWVLDFDGDGGPNDVAVDASDNGELSLVDGFIAYVPGDGLVEDALGYFSETAGNVAASLLVRATFPEQDAVDDLGEAIVRPPLEWSFDLSPESKAADRIRHVVEICGRDW